MKKLLIAIMAAMMLAGCGSSDNQTTDTSKVEYVFETIGTTIKLNEETSSILNGLGKEIEYYEAKSCAFDGMDKTYTYAGFQLLTYPKDDKDYVSSVVLKDYTVSTKEGVFIGDAKSKVEETYGTDYTDKNGAYVYTKGKSTLEFIFDGDSVSSITYTAITK